MNEVHDEVGKFTLEKETHVACVHAEVKLDHATPTNAGALLPWSTWEGIRAAEILREHGYDQPIEYGGITEWKEAGNPVVQPKGD